MSRWLVVQHQDDCPPGVLGEWAAEREIALEVVRPDRGETLPDPAATGVDAVAVLGSDRSVLQRDEVGWIDAELAWLTAHVAAPDAAPVLGICFGAQALAVALGGDVRREPAEIDWLELQVDDALGCGPGPWLCWHNDFIDPPAGARVLARSGRAVHAFAQGRHLAVQFHPEVTASIVDDWIRAEELGRDLARAGLDHCALQRRSRAFAEEAGLKAHALFDGFAARAAA